MHYFKYKKGELYAEGVPMGLLAERYGTPLYVYSAATLVRHITAYEKAFRSIPHITCFAMKANSNIAVLKLLGQHGAGADVVSGGEIARALKAGIPASKIVYAGVGKTASEIRMAIKAGILMLNVESQEELLAIDAIARSMKRRAPVSIRINPDIDAGTHPYITTGLKKYKFGIPRESALDLYRDASSLKGIEVVGVQKHIGSQITEIAPFADSLERILGLVDELRARGIALRYVDIGGGLGISYDGRKAPEPNDLAARVLPMLKGRKLTLVTEPGRSIVGNAGVLLTRVIYLKEGPGKRFVIIDGGMNDLMRPALYDAYHEILPVRKRKAKTVLSDVVGPICETGDFLARERGLPEVSPGDVLAVMSAGAYGFAMSSNYNSRPRPAEVLVNGSRHGLIRRRESLSDLMRGEALPKGFGPRGSGPKKSGPKRKK
jgi:diaminopimelate decarboxylase